MRVLMDNHSKQVRSYNMSQIKSKDSEPENIVRKFLFSKGFRYRKNVKDLPGKPDIVLKKFKTVIFVNGCFWHMHDCPEFVMPKSNEEYWIGKVNKNKMRDILNMENLKELGWKVIVIWECELKKDIRENTFSSLIKVIKDCPSNS